MHWIGSSDYIRVLINLKAIQLLQRASLNKLADFAKLQTEIFEAGKDYIQKFAISLKQEGRKNQGS